MCWDLADGSDCAAIFDVVIELAIADLPVTKEGFDRIFKIVAMMVKLCTAHDT